MAWGAVPCPATSSTQAAAAGAASPPSCSMHATPRKCEYVSGLACCPRVQVLAEINPRMPRCHGDAFLPVEAIDFFVRNDRHAAARRLAEGAWAHMVRKRRSAVCLWRRSRALWTGLHHCSPNPLPPRLALPRSPLPELASSPPDEVSTAIGRNVAALIPDGACLQVGVLAVLRRCASLPTVWGRRFSCCCHDGGRRKPLAAQPSLTTWYLAVLLAAGHWQDPGCRVRLAARA